MTINVKILKEVFVIFIQIADKKVPPTTLKAVGGNSSDKFLCCPLSVLRADMLMKIFFSCSHSTPNVTFRLIHIKNLPCLSCQSRINPFQSFCNVLMYRTFAYAEFFCGTAHSSLAFDYVFSKLNRSFFHYTFHIQTLR